MIVSKKKKKKKGYCSEQRIFFDFKTIILSKQQKEIKTK